MSDAQIVPIQKDKIGMTLRGLELSSLDDLWRFCQIIAKTPFCPKTFSAETCLAAIQFGAEVGLTPMQSLQNVAVINGKSALHTDAPLALCRRSPDWVPGVFKEWLEGEDDEMVAYCRVGRKHEETITKSFSWRDAVRAGLTGNPTYKSYPQRMLMFRARGWALRDLYGDVLKGLWSEEEARDLETPGGTTRLDLGGKESFLKADVIDVIDVTPPKPAAKVEPPASGEKKPRAVSKLKTPEKAADPAMARLERQEAAAAEKAAPKRSERSAVIAVREYIPTVQAEGLEWREFITPDWKKKSNPELGAMVEGMSDEKLEEILHHMVGAVSDAFLDRQQEHVEREPGID